MGAAWTPLLVVAAVLRAILILRSSTETPTLAGRAKMCGVTWDYLGQLLVEHSGRGFVERRNRTRLERFHILYPQSGHLLMAALDAGFGSYTQFHRVFHDLVGVTPGEWAKSSAQARSVALPSASGAIKGSDGESSRMIWYALSEPVLPAAARRFTPAFAVSFMRSPPSGEPASAISNGIGSYAEMRRFEPALIEQLRECDPMGARLLKQAFDRNDMFGSYFRTLEYYGIGPSDLADGAGDNRTDDSLARPAAEERRHPPHPEP